MKKDKIDEFTTSFTTSEVVNLRAKRIVADHIRAAAFLISDGVRPGNKEAGYVLRRLIRRIVFHEKEVGEIEGLFKKGPRRCLCRAASSIWQEL